MRIKNFLLKYFFDCPRKVHFPLITASTGHLAKRLSVHWRTKWFWVWILLQSLKLQISQTSLKLQIAPWQSDNYKVVQTTHMWHDNNTESVFTFAIIKPKTEICFSLSNVRSIIINFASQKVESFFRVTVKGPILNFKYFHTYFCCKSVSCSYMATCLISTNLT